MPQPMRMHHTQTRAAGGPGHHVGDRVAEHPTVRGVRADEHVPGLGLGSPAGQIRHDRLPDIAEEGVAAEKAPSNHANAVDINVRIWNV